MRINCCSSLGNIRRVWASVFGKRKRENQKRIELYGKARSYCRNFIWAKYKYIGTKNTGIARGIHNELSECPMGDIDILVDPDQLELAHHIMLQMGIILMIEYFKLNQFDKAFEHGGTEYTCTLIDGSTLWVNYNGDHCR